MIRVSNLCPLNFVRNASALEGESGYVQKFFISDDVLIQLFSDSPETIKGILNGAEYPFAATTIGDGSDAVYFHELHLSSDKWTDGCYSLFIKSGDVIYAESDPFIVSSNERDFDYSVKISYSHNRGDVFLNTLFADGQEFMLRVEGGFKSEFHTQNIENEQFRNEMQEITNLYSIPYEKKTLTIGDSLGVPVWVGRLLNSAFSLSTVKIDDVEYVRSESSVPTLGKIKDDYPLFNYTIDLEPANNELSDNLIPNDLSAWILATGYWRDEGAWMSNGKWNF